MYIKPVEVMMRLCISGRVIGLPGETVQISNGAVLINGEVYNENKNFPEISNAGLASDGVSLESGEYFVLGDNRNNSEDSRYGDIGNINKKYIVGKVWFVISPKDKFGFYERLGVYERTVVPWSYDQGKETDAGGH